MAMTTVKLEIWSDEHGAITVRELVGKPSRSVATTIAQRVMDRLNAKKDGR